MGNYIYRGAFLQSVPAGFIADAVDLYLFDSEAGLFKPRDEVGLCIGSNTVILTEAADTLGLIGAVWIFIRNGNVHIKGNDDDPPSVPAEDTAKFTHGLSVIPYMLKNMGADEKVNGAIT